MPQLAAACPDGCLIRRAFTGVGGVGLCMVDEENVINGARHHRSLWQFRQRVFARFKVRAAPGIGGGPLSWISAARVKEKLIILVQSKRRVTNLPQLKASVEATASPREFEAHFPQPPLVENAAVARRK